MEALGRRPDSGAWQRVLYPVPDPVVNGVPRPDLQSPYNNICNDVAIQPGSGGQHVLANCAWRDGAAYNGFYYLDRRRRRRSRAINPNGALNPQDVGRTDVRLRQPTAHGSTRSSSR